MKPDQSQIGLVHSQPAAANFGKIRAFNFTQDDLTLTGVEDEFSIDDLLSTEDEITRHRVAAASTWVADTFYPGQETLATLRLRAGLSQTQFGELIGIPQPNVSRYESGRHEPGVLLAAKMAKVLNVSIERLVQALMNAEAEAQK